MAEYSNIAWTDHTFNPWIGCTKVSPACDHCYAEAWAKHYAPVVTWGKPGQRSKLHRTAPENWKKPLRWNKAANSLALGQRRPRVFCASLADVFDMDVTTGWWKDLWDLIGATPNLDWLLLTKRPQNIRDMLPTDWGDKGWKNVWLGTTVENAEEAKRRIHHLRANPAPVHFLSCEPLLGSLGTIDLTDIEWVIIGGESGPNFRRMHMDWVAELRVQCRDANVPVFFKQDSSIKPGSKGRASDQLWNTKQFPMVTP